MLKKDELKKEAGSLMVEALAMLALIALVTPILYKKAAERTTELQDINAASQMRVMIKAVDDYLRDNYQDIMRGQAPKNDCEGDKPDFSAFGKEDNAKAQVDLRQLCDYLPYGFLDKDGNVQGSYSFGSYQLAVKKHSSKNAKSSATLTGFIIADPKMEEGIPLIRASRIAAMIGSNGGYTQGNKGNGVQGIWTINDIKNELGLASKEDGSIMAASIQPVTDGSGLNENVLYRNEVPGYPNLNTMGTTLDLGSHNIENVNQLIITADNAAGGNKDEALLLDNKAGADISGRLQAAGGKFDVNADTGNVSTQGGLHVDQGAEIGGDTEIGGAADIAGDTNIGGNLTVEQKTDLKGDLHVAGNATIDKNLTVKGDTVLEKNLTVNGDTNLKGNVTIGGPNTNLTVNSPANFKEDVTMEKNLTVNGAIMTPDLRSKTLRGGLQQTDFSNNPENDKYAFTAYWSGVNTRYNVYIGVNDEIRVGKNKVLVGTKDELQVLSDEDRVVSRAAETQIGPSDDARELIVSAGEVLVDNGVFEVQTGDNTYSQILTADKQVDIMKKKDGQSSAVLTDGRVDVLKGTDGQSIFAVQDDEKATRGSVHIRKGIIEVASKYSKIAEVDENMAGYVKADRFVDNEPWDSAAAPQMTNNGYSSSGVTPYSNYQVNPAYTSVMHDIKLTSRGGARLSDILPDFINKGIYVVDNTYNENVPYWTELTLSVKNGRVDAGQSGKECTDYSCWTSPWLGVIPAPQCPLGYAKVVTITPAGWAMAQAGVPPSGADKTRKDILTLNMPKNPNDYIDGSADAPMPLYFQKSTWLRANVYPHGSGASFKGWSAIMGFMYPYSYYKEYIDKLGITVNKDGASSSNQWVVWNLFPVLRRQLEAYVTVYCYFDRTNSSYNSKYVDKYDQLNKFREGWDKDSTFTGRLNDPTTSFKDPW